MNMYRILDAHFSNSCLKYIEIVQIFLNVSYKLYKINYNLEYGIYQEIAEDKMLRRC